MLFSILVFSFFTLLACEKTTITYGMDYDQFDYILDYDEIFSQENDIYFVYIYSPTCINCISIKSTVLEFANTYEEYHIYFLNVDNATSSLQTEYLDKVGKTKVVTPVFLIIKNQDIDETNVSNYYFSGATQIPAILIDIQNGTYQF